MREESSIKSLMLLHLYDYLEPNGHKKVKNQEIDVLDGLGIVASCALIEGKLIFQFTIGLGVTLSQLCLAYVEHKFKVAYSKKETSPYNDIPNNLGMFHGMIPESIDVELNEILREIRKENIFAHDYFYRLFEYTLGFIALHELGHYLNGHHTYFEGLSHETTTKYFITERQIAEFQADIFAVQFLLNKEVHHASDNKPISIPSFKNIGDFEWELCVTHSVFITFVLLEKAGSNEKGKVHPPSIYRIINSSKHIIGSDIWTNGLSAIEKFEKILEQFISFSRLYIRSTETWKESVYQFWGTASDSKIKGESDVFEVIKLQMATKEFRLKIKSHAANAIKNFNYDTEFLTLLIFSGKHIPWNHINTETFYHLALSQIDFSNSKVIDFIKSSSNAILIDKLNHMEINHPKQNINIVKLLEEIEKLLALNIDGIYKILGDELIDSKVIQINEVPDENKKLEIGKYWFNKFEEILKDKLNRSRTVNFYLQEEVIEINHHMILSIADIIEPICVGCSSHTAAVLILKNDLRTLLCNSVACNT